MTAGITNGAFENLLSYRYLSLPIVGGLPWNYNENRSTGNTVIDMITTGGLLIQAKLFLIFSFLLTIQQSWCRSLGLSQAQ